MLGKIEEIEKQAEEPNFWNDPQKAGALLKEKTALMNYMDGHKKISSDLSNIKEIVELNDPEMLEILSDEIENTIKFSKEYYIMCAFSKPVDKLDCYIYIQSGAGGTESQDWAAMLYRMYINFCTKAGYKLEEIDLSPGEQPGLVKSVTFSVAASESVNNKGAMPKATMPYGWLKYEHGIHRLVRISPFDSSNRRHTSFASVWVSPQLNQDVEVTINESDLEIRECKASGAGGQHVNKTNSAIQIVHKPTGLTAQSQQDRSQHRNREIAMQLLRSKLYMHELEKLQKENAQYQQERTEVSWGHQIRSYVLHPYKLVKDNRTGYEKHNNAAEDVLNGDIKDFLLNAIEQNILE